MENKSIFPSEGFIRLKSVLKIMGICRSSWLAGVKSKRFPQPVKIGPRTTAWRVEDIRALIAKLGERNNVE